MPKVGSKKFPYTAKGKKAAKAYAMGEKMESKKEKMMKLRRARKRLPRKPSQRRSNHGGQKE